MLGSYIGFGFLLIALFHASAWLLAYSFVLCFALLWQHGRKFLCNNDGGSQFSLLKNNTLVAVVCGRGIFFVLWH